MENVNSKQTTVVAGKASKATEKWQRFKFE